MYLATTEAASISEPRLQFVCRNDAPYTLEFSCTIQGPQRVRAVSSVKDVLLTEELSGDDNHGLKVGACTVTHQSNQSGEK